MGQAAMGFPRSEVSSSLAPLSLSDASLGVNTVPSTEVYLHLAPHPG
jgi:hypothetical protein